jgi:hypothetical protein
VIKEQSSKKAKSKKVPFVEDWHCEKVRELAIGVNRLCESLNAKKAIHNGRASVRKQKPRKTVT